MKVTFEFAIGMKNDFCFLDEQWVLEARKYFVALQIWDTTNKQYFLDSATMICSAMQFSRKNLWVLF